ncbi:timeless protein-domain-containing protein [Chaetomidium leptoderma]|uniref:Topoisomerase 1-associated factor 1 n=1 Tax=Chaetomidium leptoderma TaxID=669021 RepID=A0AAN7A0P1_9PEZI|nr:timeless protein-domain-containing protein [Chaetomidium leptoderma]
MEDAETNNDTVHPEVRAHINSLVSALGGYSIDETDGYKLGDDALEVLRDLKKWIRFYDEKTNRMDVARCLAEANLVGSDLLHILATWPQNDNNSKYKARIALACLEVMVPLTWPIEKDRETMTLNHHRHMPVLQLAQLGYKRAIINFDAIPILNTAVRVALPSMALPNGDRSARDQGIIKLVLYFLRNIAVIAPPPGIKYDGDETQISRSALIDAFSYQDVLHVLLTIASNMGEDFRTEDVVVMEIIFHLVKRVDSRNLFVSENQLHRIKADKLRAAMDKEDAMLTSYRKNAPTRHSRFGTMIWVKRESGKLSTVSGQDALLDAATRERKMDSSKNFKPPRRARKEDMEPKDLGPPVSLDERARQQLQSFVSDFLDSGFNPLFSHVRKSLDREAPHVLDYHHGQFYYLVAWFLEAERMRRKANKDSRQPSTGDNVGSFNLVAEVLNQEMFITMNRALDRAYGDKDWRLLTTIMRCFTQILLTVQEMSDSGDEENEEIANNILSRLFYEETTHDAITNIVRSYKDQGFEYLDASTELTHTFLRILEAYSKQNADLQVRSRKRTRRKKKAAKPAEDQGGDEDQADAEEDDSADDARQVEKISQERKFDFKRFATRFIPQGVVDTFVAFAKYYRDLDDSQLKRAHRYFYRVAIKQEMCVMLFRLDIIHLFYNMIKGPEPLDKNSSMYKEWEELSKQIIKRCVRKLDERPALFAELLFSKINSTAHYLEYGYEKQTISSNPRPAAEIEFKREVERDQQIAIVVGVLLDRNQTDHLEWIKKQLSEAESERRAWENVEKALAAEKLDGEAADEPAEGSAEKAAPHATMSPDNDARRAAMFKNPHLRLLMKLVGMERLAPTLDETPDSIWIIPGTITADALKETVSLINSAEFTPATFEDGELAEDQFRRKSAPRKRAAYDDDNNNNNNNDDDSEASENDMLFPAGGPTARKRTAEDEPPPTKNKKRLHRRRRNNKDGDGSEQEGEEEDGEAEARARARRKKELEKARKVKSEMYVDLREDDSDWEGNREQDKVFFARELERQAVKDASFGGLLLTTGGGGGGGKPSGVESADWEGLLLGVGGGEEEEADEGGEGDEGEGEKRARKGRKRKSDAAALAEGSEDEDGGTGDGESGSSSADETSASRPSKRRKPAQKKMKQVVDISSDEEDEDGDADDMDVDPIESTQSSSRDGAVTNDTPLSSSPGRTAKAAAETPVDKGDGNDEDDDMPVAKAAGRARPRARAGFIVESSDEE